jgi:Ricin-type beta-trefoil lectin domain-like
MKTARLGVTRCLPLLFCISACGAHEGLDGEDVSTQSEALVTSYAQKALLITSLDVVRDPDRTADPCDAVAGAEDKVWTIGHLLKKEAARNGKSTADYVRSWVDAWATQNAQPINGQTITLENLAGPFVRSNWPKNAQGNYLLHNVQNSHPDGKSAAMNYKMVFAHSYKCLDVHQVSTADNALVKQYTCHGQDNQRVAIVEKGLGVYNLVVKHSGKCLDVQNGSSGNDVPIVQKTCNGSTSQQIAMWFSASQNGRIMKFVHSGKCLRVRSNSTDEAAQVVQDECDPSSRDDRAFKFVE